MIYLHGFDKNNAYYQHLRIKMILLGRYSIFMLSGSTSWPLKVNNVIRIGRYDAVMVR